MSEDRARYGAELRAARAFSIDLEERLAEAEKEREEARLIATHNNLNWGTAEEHVRQLLVLLAWRAGEQTAERAMILLDCSEQELRTMHKAAVAEGAKL